MNKYYNFFVFNRIKKCIQYFFYSGSQKSHLLHKVCVSLQIWGKN